VDMGCVAVHARRDQIDLLFCNSGCLHLLQEHWPLVETDIRVMFEPIGISSFRGHEHDPMTAKTVVSRNRLNFRRTVANAISDIIGADCTSFELSKRCCTNN
jgi:hypothetical protein